VPECHRAAILQFWAWIDGCYFGVVLPGLLVLTLVVRDALSALLQQPAMTTGLHSTPCPGACWQILDCEASLPFHETRQIQACRVSWTWHFGCNGGFTITCRGPVRDQHMRQTSQARILPMIAKLPRWTTQATFVEKPLPNNRHSRVRRLDSGTKRLGKHDVSREW